MTCGTFVSFVAGAMSVISVFAATVEPAGRHKLTHWASWIVAFGEHGEVVLDDYEDHICQYQHDGVKYSLAKKTPKPDGVERYCSKAASDTTIFLQEYIDAPTHQLHIKDLHHMGRLDHKGRLCGILYPSMLVYSQKKGHKDYSLILRQPEGKMILQPPRGRNWDLWLPVCKTGECIVVVEQQTQTMDVFSMSGNILLLFCYIWILIWIWYY